MDSLTYAELESALAFMCHVDPDRRETFRSRIKQWLKTDLVDVSRSGKGTKTRYQLKHLMQLYVLHEMLDTGSTLENAVQAIAEDWALLTYGFVRSVRIIREGSLRNVYAVFSSLSLRALRPARNMRDALPGKLSIIDDEDLASIRFPGVVNLLPRYPWLKDAALDEANFIQSRVTSMLAHRSVLLNLTEMMRDALATLTLHKILDTRRFSEEFHQWEVVWGEIEKSVNSTTEEGWAHTVQLFTDMFKNDEPRFNLSEWGASALQGEPWPPAQNSEDSIDGDNS